ncbi:MAG: hypothetical protein AB8B61_06740 [Cyclobacteriaceae bacterium]
MELLSDLVKILLPASLVLLGMYLVVKNLVTKDFEKKLVELKQQNTEITLPLRLQAAERLCLFLERMSLNNLIVRVNETGITSGQLQQKLHSELRNEFNHNLSQQVYVSQKGWNSVKKAVQDITTLINKSSENIDPNSKSIELAKQIFDNAVSLSTDPTTPAIQQVKGEIQQLF